MSLRERIPWDDNPDDSDHPGLVDWEIVLSANGVYSALDNLLQSPGWHEALPDLMDDFSMLLRDAMDLERELGGADDRKDRSYIYQPSIVAHSQNTHLADRAALIGFTRDAWLATARVSPERARRAAENWAGAPYPVFRRLAFFAATQKDAIPPQQGLDWLLADGHWCLWSVETHREAMRLLVDVATRLDAESVDRLERSVLEGPPPSMYQGSIDSERLGRIVEREVWLRLAKMDDVGADLGAAARAELDESHSRHPEWQLERNESDEFPFWMSPAPRFLWTVI